MKWTDMIKFLDEDSNPYFIREILLLFLAYILISSIGSLSPGFNILRDTSGDIFLVIFIFSLISSSNEARLIERGSLSMMLTLPFKRWKFLLLRIIYPVILVSVLYTLFFSVVMAITTFTFTTYNFLFILCCSIVTLFLYISLGRLISILTKSSILTLSTLLLVFFIITDYAVNFSGRYLVIKEFLLGMYYISTVSHYGISFFYALFAEATAGAIFLLLYQLSVKKSNMRGGR